jgi:hypothetical protein
LGTRILDEGDDVITPEELVAYREWVRIMEFKDNAWPCMALTHIDQQAARIAELAAQVTALKKIAVEGWAVVEFGGEQEGQDYYLYFREWNIDRESYRKEALELLQAEHPEAFR